jgi:hypothetical protein
MNAGFLLGLKKLNRMMRPKVIVDYGREAYVCKNGGVKSKTVTQNNIEWIVQS